MQIAHGASSISGKVTTFEDLRTFEWIVSVRVPGCEYAITKKCASYGDAQTAAKGLLDRFPSADHVWIRSKEKL